MFKKKIKALASFLKALSSGVIIYQMGKVGSTSISFSLGKKVPHIHSFGPDITNYFFKRPVKKRNYINYLIKKVILFFFKLKKEPKIITLVRDPLSRNVSAFFHYLEETNKHEYENLIIDEYMSLFNKRMPHDTPLIWFQNELEKYFNIDVYGYEFDKEKGWNIIQKGKVKVLILQMEKLNENEDVIAEFLNKPDFKLVRANTASNKNYIETYNEFKSKFKPNKQLIDILYNSKYMEHFYTNAERNIFVKKWR
ncbi:putative capsular polysaccharide synthesis family protein [Gracilibacillus thailandensis]|nr:putative capsular polysaccharide synthesis family protein [Gracilibacillus thailandensis]